MSESSQNLLTLALNGTYNSLLSKCMKRTSDSFMVLLELTTRTLHIFI